MHIINKAARLIDFSWNKKKYRLMPAGKAVEVPDDAMKSVFLKSLIEDRSIEVVKELTNEEKAEIKLENLQRDATALGIKFDNNWDAKKLSSEIEFVELRKQATDLGIEFNDNWDAKKLSSEIKKKEK